MNAGEIKILEIPTRKPTWHNSDARVFFPSTLLLGMRFVVNIGQGHDITTVINDNKPADSESRNLAGI